MNQIIAASVKMKTKASQACQTSRQWIRVCWVVGDMAVVAAGVALSFLYFKRADINSMILVMSATMAVNAISDSIQDAILFHARDDT